jgi:hypothetical protein
MLQEEEEYLEYSYLWYVSALKGVMFRSPPSRKRVR